MIFDCFQHGCNLLFGKDSFGELSGDFDAADGGADVERQISQFRGERKKRLKRLETSRSRRRSAAKRVGVFLEVGQVGRAQRLAAERAVGGEVVGVCADGVRALAVEPQRDEFVVARRRRNGQRDDHGFFRRRQRDLRMRYRIDRERRRRISYHRR